MDQEIDEEVGEQEVH